MTQAWTAGRALFTARPARSQSRAMARVVRLTSRFAVVTAAVAAVAGAALAMRDVSGLDRWFAFTAVIYLPVVLVGAAMTERQPRNPVGWIFLVSGWSLPVSTVLHLIGVVRGGDSLVVLGLVSGALFVFGVPLAALFGVLLFPDGRLGSRRRRALARTYGVAMVLLLIYCLFSPTVVDGSEWPTRSHRRARGVMRSRCCSSSSC